jgi:hypothetical protein
VVNGTQLAAPAAPRRVGLRVATLTALAASVAILAGGLLYLQRLDADYRELGATPGALADLAFRFLHSGAWLAAALVLAACVFAGAYLLARRHGTWLVLLAPLVFLLVTAVSLMLISAPLQPLVEVVK